MGFSLELFFRDIEAVLNDSVMQHDEKVAQLKRIVSEARDYAGECGALPNF